MTRRALVTVSAVVIATMIGVAVAVGQSLPADMPLPIHWGIDGQPDRFSDKWTALLIPVLITGGLSLLFYFLPALEPREKGLKRSQGLYLWGWASLLLISVLVQLAVLSAALHWAVHATSFVIGGVGLVFILIGNQLGKSRSMYLVGIRTPWTLASEEVWIKTHRVGGKLMVVAGVPFVVAAFLPLPAGVFVSLLIGMIAMTVLVPIIYSYLLWRREQKSDQRNA